MFERRVECFDRAFEQRCIGQIETIAFLHQQLPGTHRLGHSGRSEVNVGPAGKAVFEIPGRFTVAHQNKFMHETGPKNGTTKQDQK